MSHANHLLIAIFFVHFPPLNCHLWLTFPAFFFFLLQLTTMVTIFQILRIISYKLSTAHLVDNWTNNTSRIFCWKSLKPLTAIYSDFISLWDIEYRVSALSVTWHPLPRTTLTLQPTTPVSLPQCSRTTIQLVLTLCCYIYRSCGNDWRSYCFPSICSTLQQTQPH